MLKDSSRRQTITAIAFRRGGERQGDRLEFADWEAMLDALIAAPDGFVRFAQGDARDPDASADETGGVHVLRLAAALLPEWFLHRLRREHAFLLTNKGVVLLPVRAKHHPLLSTKLREAELGPGSVGVPLDPRIVDGGGSKLFDPRKPPTGMLFRFRHAGHLDAQRALVEETKREANWAKITGAVSSADVAGTEQRLWVPMLPSVVIEPLAAILAGQTVLHGDELRVHGESIAKFHGTSDQHRALGGATAHRVVRELLRFQQTTNHGEIVGRVAALARRCGVQPNRAKRVLVALERLELEGQPVLKIETARRGRSHLLRVSLRGPLASGYFGAGRVTQSRMGRRVVPIPAEAPDTTSRDTAAGEMSLHLLLMGHLREHGERNPTSVCARLSLAELHRFADLVGLTLRRATTLMEVGQWSGSLLNSEFADGEYMIWVTLDEMPSLYVPLSEGLFLTESAKKHRRGRRMQYQKRQKYMNTQ